MFTPLPFFNPWMLTNPTLPKMYWEVKSPEQLIANLYCIIDAIKDPLNDTIELSNKNAEAIEKIENVIESIKNGMYYDKYIDGLAKWIDANLQQLVARQSKFVFPTFYQEPIPGAGDTRSSSRRAGNISCSTGFSTNAITPTISASSIRLRSTYA
jgi:hypothetical protein